MILRFRTSTLVILVAVGLTSFASGQQPAVSPSPSPTATPAKSGKQSKAAARDALKNPTAEQVVESSIFIYGLGNGRVTLNQIRKTTLERGRTTVTNAAGKTDQATYQRWTQRADTLDKEKIRLDQVFPTASYSMVFNESKIYGIVDNSVFVPREDASKAFQNQIVHGLEAVLRYKENESTLALAGKEKMMGVEYYIINVTDKQARKTRFYISAKTFRVMMLDYEEDGVKYRRRFYDYNYAQGTLVPYRTILMADDKVVEETEVGTVTFGQKIDETLFAGS